MKILYRKILLSLIDLLLCGLIVGCSEKDKSDRSAKYQSLKKTECEESKEIRESLKRLSAMDTLDMGLLDSTIMLFEKDDASNDSCFGFPYEEDDDQLFYSMKEKLITGSIKNHRYIKQYIALSKSINRNIEWSEELSQDLGKIAMGNPRGFLIVLKNAHDKKFVAEVLSYLNEFDYLEIFEREIEAVHDDSLKPTVSAVKNEIKQFLN